MSALCKYSSRVVFWNKEKRKKEKRRKFKSGLCLLLGYTIRGTDSDITEHQNI